MLQLLMIRVADDWVCKNPNLKLTAAQHRILGTHFTVGAYKHALSVVNIAGSFKQPGYQYDANDSLIWFRPKRALECDNANEQRRAKKQAQASLMQL